MNQRERFLAVAKGQKPDYYPVFGFNEAPGVSSGCMRTTYNRLLETGMPDIGGVWELDGQPYNLEGWQKYWGVCTSLDVTEFPGEPGGGFKYTKTIKDGFEFIECETGALTRQILHNDITYSMPEYIRFHVYDRDSWEFYKARRSAGKPYTAAQRSALCKKYSNADRPVRLSVNSTFGTLRDIVGPEMACTIFYDDEDLARDILGWLRDENQRYYIPLIETLKPDIVLMSEDLCYNHGMFISPDMFREFMLPSYIEICQAARGSGVEVVAVDTDGFAEQMLPLMQECGVNAMFPWEVKSNNDLLRVRKNYPEMILLGGLEKEVLNTGNEGLIFNQIMSKVPQLLQSGRYFPNADHGIQPLVNFSTMCKFMTLLHEVCENPEGEFPRMKL